jgi:hypothetical protein
VPFKDHSFSTDTSVQILYRAATKTFHSTQILRYLFTVHASLAEFELAFKAFGSYIEIVTRGKDRAEQEGQTDEGVDDDPLLRLFGCCAALDAAKMRRRLSRSGGISKNGSVTTRTPSQRLVPAKYQQNEHSSSLQRLPLHTVLLVSHRRIGHNSLMTQTHERAYRPRLSNCCASRSRQFSRTLAMSMHYTLLPSS